MKNEGWHLLDDDAHVLWREYVFSRGARATTMVFRGADGLVVVSPATGMADRDFDELREHGEVRALVANNTYHHMGQASWRARFPEAKSYAPRDRSRCWRRRSPTCRSVRSPSSRSRATLGWTTRRG
jgi:hypothetical protein